MPREGSSFLALSNVQFLDTPAVELLNAAGIAPEPIRWLWRHHLARGKLHVIAGSPGTAKTTLALAFIAILTSGGRWPDGTRTEPSNALIWSGEDDAKDTLIPRLIAMGADLSRVYVVGDVLAEGKPRPFDPARDMETLERAAACIGDVGILMVDPVVQAVSGDSHKNTEVRRALQPLTDLVRRLDAVGIGVSHFTKGSAGRDPIERVTGSVAFGALPRMVFAAVKTTDKDGNVSRLFVRAKSNLGPDGGGFAFALEEVQLEGHSGITATRVLFTDAIEGTARDILAAAEDLSLTADRNATDEALDWLQAMLETGPMRASDVQKQARLAGISDKGLRRARERLGVRPRKMDFSGGWEWALPAKMPQKVPHQKQGILGTLGTFEGGTTPTEDAQDVEDAQVSTLGERGILAEPCPKCAGEGCQWCDTRPAQ